MSASILIFQKLHAAYFIITKIKYLPQQTNFDKYNIKLKTYITVIYFTVIKISQDQYFICSQSF